ncbi:GntR family transcriptional regulator [Nonomuraea zeae]|uniref:GntR family transcriptional regulator n=1 Tax=Nonomuraea zeae TaxID=1642303 RepID=A0A5S4FTX6_9ACTN|nr:GntR family transcriptional regulator [Nonomuraea zeae]TMR24118.1 GntR family transcriptional regulator [Nonomuraea zeae]
MTNPGARIAADIKQRIADGRLRPGDRVPSTRQLARDWGVALATAAKVLTRLAQEGVVVAEPRVGTVVAEPRAGNVSAGPRAGTVAAGPVGAANAGSAGSAGSSGGKGARRVAPGRDPARERIVRAAIEIADAEGLAELTMRRVAGVLGMATMSLYRHVAGKEDLVMLMIDTAIGRFPLPEDAPRGWRARLEISARLQWAVYRAHPWSAGVTPLTRPLASPSLLKHSEFVMEALQDTGVDAMTKMYVQILIYSYVQGIGTHIELERQAKAATGVTGDEWVEGQEELLRLVTTANPAMARMLAELGDFDLDLDWLFEFGLGPLLDGLTPLLDGPTPLVEPG